jgi:hypothetical protein
LKTGAIRPGASVDVVGMIEGDIGGGDEAEIGEWRMRGGW